MDRIIANRYARALFQLAQEKNAVSRYEEDAKLVMGVLESDEEFNGILNYPRVGKEEKLSLIKEAFKDHVDENIIGFFAVILSKGRIDLAKDIFQAFLDLARESERITVAKVESAIALDEGKVARIKEKLSAKLNKKVDVLTSVDPSLIGGMKIYVDGHIIDSTVKTHIENMRAKLLNINA